MFVVTTATFTAVEDFVDWKVEGSRNIGTSQIRCHKGDLCCCVRGNKEIARYVQEVYSVPQSRPLLLVRTSA